MRVEDFDDLGKVGERAGQPVDLVDDDGVDLPRRDIGQQPLERRPIHRRRRKSRRRHRARGSTLQPSCLWLLMKASQASRWASRELNSCSSPLRKICGCRSRSGFSARRSDWWMLPGPACATNYAPPLSRRPRGSKGEEPSRRSLRIGRHHALTRIAAATIVKINLSERSISSFGGVDRLGESKNRGPDQHAPVIAWAMLVSDR